MITDETLDRIRAFNADRQWGPYHNPKNLSMALASEVGELCSEFRWLDETASDEHALSEEVESEIADVAIILYTLVDRIGVDLDLAVRVKLNGNAMKYPK